MSSSDHLRQDHYAAESIFAFGSSQMLHSAAPSPSLLLHTHYVTIGGQPITLRSAVSPLRYDLRSTHYVTIGGQPITLRSAVNPLRYDLRSTHYATIGGQPITLRSAVNIIQTAASNTPTQTHRPWVDYTGRGAENTTRRRAGLSPVDKRIWPVYCPVVSSSLRGSNCGSGDGITGHLAGPR